MSKSQDGSTITEEPTPQLELSDFEERAPEPENPVHIHVEGGAVYQIERDSITGIVGWE